MPEGHSPQCLFHLASECMVDSPILSNGLFCCKHYLRGRFRWCQLFTCVSTAESFFSSFPPLSGMILGGLLLCNYFEMYKIEEKRTSSQASYKLIFLLAAWVLHCQHLFEKEREAGYWCMHRFTSSPLLAYSIYSTGGKAWGAKIGYKIRLWRFHISNMWLQTPLLSCL